MAQDKRVADFLERNKKFASAYSRPPMMAEMMCQDPAPEKPIMIISCIDRRLNPYEYFGLKSQEAGISLNAGGRAAYALRDLMVLDTIAGGIETVLIVHHTDCGLTHVSDENVRAHLREVAPSKSDLIGNMEFGEIKDMDQSVKDDVELVRSSSYLKVQNVHGYVFDLEDGTLREVLA